MRGKLTFGSVSEKAIEDFMIKCREFFPRAWAFLSDEEKLARKIVPPSPSGEATDKRLNGVPEYTPNSLPSGDTQKESAEGQCELKYELKSSVEPQKTIENGEAEVKDSRCINTV